MSVRKEQEKKKLLFFLLTFGKLLSYVQGVPYEKACLLKIILAFSTLGQKCTVSFFQTFTIVSLQLEHPV